MKGLASSGLAGAIGLVTALALSTWTAGPENPSASGAAAPTVDCEATFDPDTVEQGDVHEEVAVHLSESIGEIEEVETPQASDLDVLWVHDDDPDDPQEGRVRLSALRAEVGEWTVIVHGETGTCEGVITVVNDGA